MTDQNAKLISTAAIIGNYGGHIESSTPVQYRLARRNGELILQGAYQWHDGRGGGLDWRDEKTVDLSSHP